MNSAEIKLDLFRKIDGLSESELQKVYTKFLALLSSSTYKLSKEEKLAVNEALKVSEDEPSYSREEVMEQAKSKYPNLNFK